MNLVIYPRLSTRSRRAIRRVKGRYGNPYEYRPRITLVSRLSDELGLTVEAVFDQIEKEREWLIRERF